MAKKKQQFPNRKRNTIIGVVICLIVVTLASVGCGAYYVWDRNEKSYIGTINGERVPTGLFRLNLLEQQIQMENQWGSRDIWYYQLTDNHSFADEAKDQAYMNTMSVMLSAMKARELGADSLTAEENESIEAAIEMFPEWYGAELWNYINLSKSELREVLRAELYAENLYNSITDDLFEFSEADFQAAFDAHFASEEDMMRRYEFYYIITSDEDAIREVQSKSLAGADFKELMAEYSMNYYPPDEIEFGNASNADEAAVEETVEEIPEETEVETVEDEETEGETEGETADEADEDTVDSDMPDFDDMEAFTLDLSNLVADPNLIPLYGYDLPEELQDFMFGMRPGDISGIVPYYDESGTTRDSFAIFQMVNVIDPNREEEEEYFREFVYIPEHKQRIYDVVFASWLDEAAIVQNDRAFKSVSIVGLQ